MRKCIQIMNFQFRQIRLKSNWEIRKMGKYFGTDGFRGEANVVLTVAGITDRITKQRL